MPIDTDNFRDNIEYYVDDDTYEEEYYDYEEELIDGVGFADPGGRSSLRAETKSNPRNCSCPTCGTPNVLTRIDKNRGYQCNCCADAVEFGFDRGN